MERLTSSHPYVMDIHGYCGQSVMAELAFSESKLDTLYQLTNGMEGVDMPYVLQTKLQTAAMISFVLSHFHNIAVDGMVSELWQKIDPQPLHITLSIQGMSS